MENDTPIAAIEPTAWTQAAASCLVTPSPQQVHTRMLKREMVRIQNHRGLLFHKATISAITTFIRQLPLSFSSYIQDTLQRFTSCIRHRERPVLFEGLSRA